MSTASAARPPYEVRIEATDRAPAGAAPETAAVRLIVQLPAGWTAELGHCESLRATLSVTGADSARDLAEVLDGLLGTGALLGWVRV
ncbi:hypothetical protein ACH4SP_15030 [Streptomyces sp. NPDC021093]|uniref:hypothetical protein n=1 Tax=Streptomyces sp. NPDC021093 TaxID=3365112 RepID=UPI0037985849